MRNSTCITRKLGILSVSGLLLASGILLLTSSCMMHMTGCKKTLAETQVSDKPAVGTVYTCPMHPEVVKNGPGSCPKCGMNLVAK